MSYVVDMIKPQAQLVKELFNHFNTEAYDINHLILTGQPTPLEGAYNTAQNIDINPLPEGTDVSGATIFYNRIDIATLFSVVEVKLREVDIKADGAFDEALVLQEVQRKYGINTETGHFGTKQIEGQDVFYAKAANPAFIGYSPLVVEASLETRVQDRELSGFNMQQEIAFDDVWITSQSVVVSPIQGVGSTGAVIGDYVYMCRGNSSYRFHLVSETWEAIANTPSLGLHLASVAYNGDWYLLGGRFGADNNSLVKYSPTTGVWSVVKTLPVALVQPGAAVVGNKLWFYGGWINNGARQNKLYSYDFVKGTVTDHGGHGKASQGPAMAAIDQILYIYGGYDVAAHDQFLRFDTATETWLDDGIGPKPNINHYMCAIGSKLYMAGGATDQLLTYDAVTDVWTARSPLPASVFSGVFVFDEVRTRLLWLGGNTTKVYIYS
jgi:hypothetical protein